MGAGGGEERMSSSGEDLHISEEKKLMENATYSISCHIEPEGYFTYLALMLLQWQGSIFPIRHAQMEKVPFPQFSKHDGEKKMLMLKCLISFLFSPDPSSYFTFPFLFLYMNIPNIK